MQRSPRAWSRAACVQIRWVLPEPAAELTPILQLLSSTHFSMFETKSSSPATGCELGEELAAREASVRRASFARCSTVTLPTWQRTCTTTLPSP